MKRRCILKKKYKTDEMDLVPQKNREYYRVIVACLNGEITTRDAARILDVTQRTVQKKIRNFKREGISVFRHKNEGSTKNTVLYRWRDEIIRLYRDRYRQMSFADFHRTLEAKHKIILSKTSLVSILKGAGYESPNNAFHHRANANDLKDANRLIGFLNPYMEIGTHNSPIVDYGCVYCCDKLYNIILRAMKKQISLDHGELYRTNPRILEAALEHGFISDMEPWEAWKNHHKYFAIVAEDDNIRLMVMNEIRLIYYPMLCAARDTLKKRIEDGSNKSVSSE